jgi:hypothetical protein
MNEEWNKIFSKSGKLMYEGFTSNEMPFGSGTSYYSNGRKCQEGVFDEKGLLYGREYYRNGKLRFEGAYKHNSGYGPNYPVFGSCYDEDGKELFYGELTIRKSGLGWPTIVKPECFGLTEPKGKPDFIKHRWESTRKKPCGKYYVHIRSKKERKSFIDFLEKNGFKCEDAAPSAKESALDSRFPITVDIGHKKYGHMNSITCAAAAATAKVIISAEEFYMLYEIVSTVVIV